MPISPPRIRTESDQARAACLSAITGSASLWVSACTGKGRKPSTIGLPKRPAGFTLVEMLVVLTVLGLVAALAVGRMGNGTGRVHQERVVAALKTEFAAARRTARRTGQPVRIDPSSVERGATIDRAPFQSGNLLTFYPDGSSSGGTVLLNGRPLIEIDWLTGEADRAD